jgi:hypothetical protein
MSKRVTPSSFQSKPTRSEQHATETPRSSHSDPRDCPPAQAIVKMLKLMARKDLCDYLDSIRAKNHEAKVQAIASEKQRRFDEAQATWKTLEEEILYRLQYSLLHNDEALFQHWLRRVLNGKLPELF